MSENVVYSGDYGEYLLLLFTPPHRCAYTAISGGSLLLSSFPEYTLCHKSRGGVTVLSAGLGLLGRLNVCATRTVRQGIAVPSQQLAHKCSEAK